MNIENYQEYASATSIFREDFFFATFDFEGASFWLTERALYQKVGDIWWGSTSPSRHYRPDLRNTEEVLALLPEIMASHQEKVIPFVQDIPESVTCMAAYGEMRFNLMWIRKGGAYEPLMWVGHFVQSRQGKVDAFLISESGEMRARFYRECLYGRPTPRPGPFPFSVDIPIKTHWGQKIKTRMTFNTDDEFLQFHKRWSSERGMTVFR